MHQNERNCIIPTICLCSRFCVSERRKLYYTHNMFMFYALCIKKRETLSYLQYAYDLDFVYQKEGDLSYLQYVYALDFVYQKKGNCIIPTICLCPRFCVSERGKLDHANNMLMFQIFCIRKRETVSYLQYVYVLIFVYQQEESCIIPAICLCSRFCV